MSGDWIPMRTDLDEDPSVIGIAQQLNVSETQVVGWLWKLWSVASRQTATGWLPHYTLERIDRLVDSSGFAEALEAVGWLHPRKDGVEIPHYDHWLSNSAKKRFKEAMKKRLSRMVSNVEKDSSAKTDKGDVPCLSPPVGTPLGQEGVNLLSPLLSSPSFLREDRGVGEGEISGTGNSDEPEDPRAWHLWLVPLWRMHSAGCRMTDEQAGAYFRAMIDRGCKPTEIRDRIRQKERVKTQPIWEFEKAFFPRPKDGLSSRPSPGVGVTGEQAIAISRLHEESCKKSPARSSQETLNRMVLEGLLAAPKAKNGTPAGKPAVDAAEGQPDALLGESDCQED